MRRILSSLKLDLKILDSLFFLLFIILITSCQTVTLHQVSKEVESPQLTKNPEYKLPLIDTGDPLNIITSNISLSPDDDRREFKNNLPTLEFEPMEKPNFTREMETTSYSNYSLPPLEVVVEPEPVVAKSVIVKPTVTNNVVSKPVVTKPAVSTSVITKPTVTAKTESEPLVSKPSAEESNITDLDEIEVFYGKSFTVEMDQSGWLYEKEIENLQFKNKFYTNNKVLFEFFTNIPGEYNLEFSKYTESGKSISRVKVKVLDKEIIADEVVKSESETIIPEVIQKTISAKSRLEADLENIQNVSNPDEVYFKLAEIYFDEGQVRKSKEYYEYVYDNYPLSIYYDKAKRKMDYIINNFLIRK